MKKNSIIEDIITACSEDTRLVSIIDDISKMPQKERYAFRKKISLILASNKSVDKEALKFYYYVTEENIAVEIIRRLRDEKT
jgi:hypothetical protein